MRSNRPKHGALSDDHRPCQNTDTELSRATHQQRSKSLNVGCAQSDFPSSEDGPILFSSSRLAVATLMFLLLAVRRNPFDLKGVSQVMETDSLPFRQPQR